MADPLAPGDDPLSSSQAADAASPAPSAPSPGDVASSAPVQTPASSSIARPARTPSADQDGPGRLPAVASYGQLLGGGESGGADGSDADDRSPPRASPSAPTPALPPAGAASTTKASTAVAAVEEAGPITAPSAQPAEDLDPLSAAAAAAADDPLGGGGVRGSHHPLPSRTADPGALPPAAAGATPAVAAVPVGITPAPAASQASGPSVTPAPASTATAGPLRPPSFPPPPYARIAVTDPVHRADGPGSGAAAYIPGLNPGHWTFRVTTAAKGLEELCGGGAGGRGGATAAPPVYPPSVPRPGSTTAVRRRFRDFVDLADLLKISHRGWAIPPRPDKVAGMAGDALSAVSGGGGGGGSTSTPTTPRLPPASPPSSTPDWVEARRAALATYLARLAAHPAIGPSQQLAVFLTAEGPLHSSPAWTALHPFKATLLEGVARLPRQLFGAEPALPSPADVRRSAAASGDLYRRLKELGVALRNELRDGGNGGVDGGAASPPPPEAAASSSTLPLPPGEPELRAARAAVDALGEALAAASRRAEAVVAAWEASGAALGDAGLALLKLAKGQDSAAAAAGLYTAASAAAARVAADARRTGTTAVRLSRFARAATNEAAAALEPLHSALAMVPPVARALREREAALLTWQSVREELDAKRAAKSAADAAAAAGDPSAARKAATAADAIAALALAETAAAAEWRAVAGRNVADLARTAAERHAGLACLVRELAAVGAAFETRCAAVWSELAELGAAAAAAAAGADGSSPDNGNGGGGGGRSSV